MTNLLRPHLHLVYCRFIFINKTKIFFLMMQMCDLYHTSPTNMSWFVPHKCNCKTKCKQTLSHIYKITTGNKIQITRFCIIINMSAISLSGAFLISIFVGHLQSSLSDNHSHHVRSIYCMQAFMTVCIIAVIVMNYEPVPLTEGCPLKLNLCIKRILSSATCFTY